MKHTRSSKKSSLLTKRSFSLLELMIALILMGTLLSSLFYILSQTITLNHTMDEKQVNAFKQIIAQKKLEYVFDHLQTEKDYQALFYVQEIPGGPYGHTSCINLTYDNGIDLSNVFSNTVYGQIFLDEKNRLMLRTWPLPVTFKERYIPMREHILFEKVAQADFSFYKWDKKEGQGSWITTWSKEQPQQKEWPHLVRLHLEFLPENKEVEGKKTLFSFMIPHAIQTIKYH